MGKLPFERGTREVLIKRDAKTSEKFGKRPEERTVEELLTCGIVNIDKPKGPTSHQVSAYVRDILGVDKTGHSGTLDPKVTGVLPVAYGRATRIVQALLPAGKEYVCIMHLHKPVPEQEIKDVMSTFVGKIKQLPPIKSAVKRDWRYRKVYYIDIHEIDGQDVLFTIGCQAGTYIRKICHDIGQALGVGAHMAELRRTKAGPFQEDTAVDLYTLKDALIFYREDGKEQFIRECLFPIEKAVEHLHKVWVLDSAVNSLVNGANLKLPGVAKIETEAQIDDLVAVFTLKDELIALGRLKMLPSEVMKKDTGVVVKVEKVFMEKGIYPKIEKS
ncbi:RNA-guided pseudouridylation complex pseudouridine synthase subunit Cbf5 [Candidatus Woesearchaeota archaeon]|nr:MAG: RNA-guided pseudouridylation complex pseudouridine synthase subunit Cbf5 [Candidatus Woesearchaeota archaeon]